MLRQDEELRDLADDRDRAVLDRNALADRQRGGAPRSASKFRGKPCSVDRQVRRCMLLGVDSGSDF